MLLFYRHRALLFAALASASAAVAALALWTLSRARTSFDYMVVGALLAALGLMSAFSLVVRRSTRLRAARKTEPPS